MFIIGPDKRLKLSILYPATTGRNFDEILRVVDSLQLTDAKHVATPVDWVQGDNVMVPPSVKQEEFQKLYPKGVKVHDVPSGKVRYQQMFINIETYCFRNIFVPHLNLDYLDTTD